MSNEIEVRKIDDAAGQALDKAKALVVTNKEQFEFAGSFRETLKVIEDKINETFDPIISSAHKTWKSALAERDRHREPVEEARKLVKLRMISYQEEVERQKRLEEAKLQAEAKKVFEAQQRAEAKALKQAGDKEAAKAVMQAEFTPPTLAKVELKAPGFVSREIWRAKVVNPALVPDDFWVIDEAKLGALARSTKGTVSVPGVKFYPEKV